MRRATKHGTHAYMHKVTVYNPILMIFAWVLAWVIIMPNLTIFECLNLNGDNTITKRVVLA